MQSFRNSILTTNNICAFIHSVKDVNIIPIFNQSAPGIWDDFVRVQSETMAATYNYNLTPDLISGGVPATNRRKSVAFAAYADGQMVGYIQGDAHGRCATIQSLYVLKDFQRMKIGHGLLQSFERAVALFADRIELQAEFAARPFYQSNGYLVVSGTSTCEKLRLTPPRCGVVPLFGCTRSMAVDIQTIVPTFDANAVNKNRAPVYVYLNDVGRLDGVGIDGVAHVSERVALGMRPIVHGCLMRSMSKSK